MPLETAQLPTEQTRVQANPLDANGNPAQIDATNPLRAEVVSGPGRVVDAGAPNQVVLIFGDSPGDVTVFNVVGDADLGAGVVELSDQVTGTVSQPLATALGLGVVNEPRV